MDNGQLTNIVEALLFAAAEPLPAKAICKVVEGTKEDDVSRAVTALNDRYMQTDSSFRVREIAGGFQLHTLPKYADHIETLLAKTKIQRLSAAALETLAVIAYRQPVSTPELEKIRGVESSGVLRTLLERNLVAITGRSDGPGRPLLYGTTREFLYYFGLNELRELPRIEELEKLLERQDFSRQLSIELDIDATKAAEKPSGETDISVAADTPELTEVDEESTAVPETDDDAGDETLSALDEGEPPPATAEIPAETAEPGAGDDASEAEPEDKTEESPAEESAPRQLVMKRPVPESVEPEEEPVRLREAVKLSAPNPEADTSDEPPLTELEVPVPKHVTDQDDNGGLIKTVKDILDTPAD